MLLIALVVLLGAAAMAAMRRRSQGYAYEAPGSTYDSPISPRQYNPEKIGNDASARPWESGFDPNEAGLRIGSGLRPHALEGSQQWGVPAGFDTEGFLRSAKRNFVTLQDAWDRGDVATLRGMMTDAMLGEIRKQLAERERQGGAPNQTEVVLLEAQLLGIEDTAGDYLASVEFSGMVREDPSAGPSPFREVWNMAKPKDGSAGWLVAGVQALQ